ncbi:MAG: transporter substrate-binding domain-containing protein, partial [Treponema sp.]|nr:transporter substrate-binding domain-containing protein [Treponema sp.]
MYKLKIMAGLYIAGLLLLCMPGCGREGPLNGNEHSGYISYRDIPGISEEEIRAIEALSIRRSSFIYGMTLSTDAFYDQDNRMKGFSVLFCQWLTRLFGITFKTTIYEWDALIAGFTSQEIDFTGELTKTEERLKTYYMTDAIAERGIKLFRITGSEKLPEITKFRPLRYAFLEGTITHAQIAALERNPFEIVFVDGYETAYEKLKSGEVDAYIEEEVSETAFDNYHDVSVENFLPLTYSMVSLATANPDFEPIISVVQKAIQSGFIYHILNLHDQGRRDYMRYKMSTRFNENERNYIRDRITSNRPVPIVAEYDNYPCSFYNTSEKEWQGSAFDVLKEIEALTGLSFSQVNQVQLERPELSAMLETGEAAMITSLIRQEEQRDRFLRPGASYQTDYYSLISRADYRDINLHEIIYRRVGLVQGASFAEDFQKWFPLARTTEYPNLTDAFNALEQEEVDLVMATNNLLLGLTNYKERLGFKVNVIFKESQEYTFGFNPEEAVLCSIVSKALALIDTETISGRWTRRVFDYQGKLARAQIPWLISISSLMLCLLVLFLVIFLRHRQGKKELEILVRERTRELELQTQVAKTASRAKSAFLARMSHEIRTPLNAIIGLSEVELQDEVPLKTRTNLEKIYSSGSTLLEIVNDILDISKIEAGNYDITPVKYDIAGIINDTIQLNIVRIGSKPVEFKLKLEDTIPRRLFGDELRIKQILNNLLSNAIKYTEKGVVALEVSWERQGDTARLHFTVRDTGRGIRKEELGKLFTEYTQLDIMANRKIEGTG